MPMPFPLTLRHYYNFGQLLTSSESLTSPTTWDYLRRQHRNFYVADERVAWLRSLDELKDGQDSALIARSAAIVELLDQRGIGNLHSVAVGAAGLEFHIKRLAPKLHLTISEFAPDNITRLRKVFLECDRIELFDICSSDWNHIQKPESLHSLVLMYRTEPHFSDRQWREIFTTMAAKGVLQILFIPSHIVNLPYLVMVIGRRCKYWAKHSPLTFTGYVRTHARFMSLWRGIYACQSFNLCGMRGYWLKRNKLWI